MQRLLQFTCLFSAVLTFTFLLGCGGPDGPTDVSGLPPKTNGDNDKDGHEEHEGPHDGHVIELGKNHEYHAELVENDEGKSVTIYMLDKDLKELTIEADKVLLNLDVDGAAKNFELTATEPSDGKTSRFDSNDADLFKSLHEGKETVGKLRVTIAGKPMTGEIHHHGHDDDDETHEGHDHDKHNDKD